MKSLRKLFNKININSLIIYDEPLCRHCTFNIGGNADVFTVPQNTGELGEILSVAYQSSVPVFILGGGANILFSDEGYRGIVIDTSKLDAVSVDGTVLSAQAGASFSKMAETAADHALGGLDYFYGMPGSAGGSIYMNARCYGQSVSDILQSVKYIDAKGGISEYIADKNDFAYKKSPFQENGYIIIEGRFTLSEDDRTRLWTAMEGHKKERADKGHYMYPCAGSFFKNNRDFGQPTGMIIDSLGLKGLTVGGAMVSPEHANIIVNAGNASSADVKELALVVQEKVYREYGFSLEREVVYID